MKLLAQPTSLRELAAETIRAEILSGELGAGEIHSAAVIAEKLGVSPTPVREAMLDLANAGLVEPVRNRGFRVLDIDDHDLDEITELRMLIEVPVARVAASRLTEEILALLEGDVIEIEAAAESGDTRSFLQADRRFHLRILETSGNGRIVRLITQLRDQTRLIGLRPLAKDGGLMASAHEHRLILDALRAGDGGAAQRLMHQHLKHTRGIWAGRAEIPASEGTGGLGSARERLSGSEVGATD